MDTFLGVRCAARQVPNELPGQNGNGTLGGNTASKCHRSSDLGEAACGLSRILNTFQAQHYPLSH